MTDGTLAAWSFEPRRVEKPWGHELIWALADAYCGKVLFVRAGQVESVVMDEQEPVQVRRQLV